MRYITFSLIVMLLSGLVSCTKTWDEHYLNIEETVNDSQWNAIKNNTRYSDFVSVMEEFSLDTIFKTGGSFTLFVPTNDAFDSFNSDTGDMSIIMRYHVLDYVFNTIIVTKSKLVRTTTGKFAPIELYEGVYSYGGMDVSYTSPLYIDGRFYEIQGVAYPRPNLYEYISLNSMVLKEYISAYDSVLLDYEKSTPLGFDESGNIYYDSVYTEVNYFDSIYFPLNQEDRNKTATFVVFNDEQYAAALDEMAVNLGGAIVTGDDIPEIWKDEVLIPNLIENGLFPNSLQYEDLAAGRLKNVVGDSVDIEFENIDPDSRLLCSNGIVFNYHDFKVPEYLYRGEVRIEGEHMVYPVGAGIYFWKPGFTVTGSNEVVTATPLKSISIGAENDSLVVLPFPGKPYEGEFSFEFYFKNMFPQKYLFVMGANYRPSGVYKIYVNDILIREFDTFELRKTVYGVNGEYYFPDDKGNNRFDAEFDHLTEYGDIKITITYSDPGGPSGVTPDNGFNVDFISLIPTD